MLIILKALIPLLKEMCFGKEDPLDVLSRNKTSSILAVTCITLAITVCGLIYAYINLFGKHKVTIDAQKQAVVVTTKDEAITIKATDAETIDLMLAQLQRIEIKLNTLQKQCKAPVSNNTPPANSTEPLDCTAEGIAHVNQ